MALSLVYPWAQTTDRTALLFPITILTMSFLSNETSIILLTLLLPPKDTMHYKNPCCRSRKTGMSDINVIRPTN